MDFYDGMLKKINGKTAECDKRKASMLKEVDKFKNEIQELKTKQIAAVNSSDADAFAKLDSEIKMREMALERVSSDVDKQLQCNMVEMSVILGMRDEVINYTNGQMATKYKKIQELVTSMITVIGEIDDLNSKYADCCDEIARFGSNYSNYDKYDFQGSFYHLHRMPNKVREVSNDSMGSLLTSINNYIELDDYVS